MNMTTTELGQHRLDLDRMKVLAREMGMLRKVQPHLRGCAVSQNLRRIKDRQDELDTLNVLAEIHARLAGG